MLASPARDRAAAGAHAPVAAGVRESGAFAGAGRRRAAVVAGYLLLTAWWLWPLPLHLADHLILPDTRTPLIEADLDLITWALAWDTHALLHHPWSLFDANIFHPARSALAFSEHFLGYVPLFAPAYLATGNPVLATNAVIVLSFPLCALAAYALARRFVAPPAAFVAGALFAFHAERYVNLYHLHQLGTFPLPLALLFTERWLESARRRDAIALAAAVGLQLLTSFYLAYAIVLLYGAYLPLALWRWRARLDRRRVVGLAVALLLGGLPAVLASIPYLRLQRLGLVPSGDSAMVRLALEPFVTMGRIRKYLTTLGVGPVGYALGATALIAGWRRGGAYPRVVALAAIVTGLLLAAGPRILLARQLWWSPYDLLFRFLPGFSAVRLPFRFLVIAQLGFALLAALGVAVLLRRASPRAGWALAVAAVVVALAAAGPRPAHPLQPQTTAATLPAAYRWLAEHAHDGALLELPMADPRTTGRRMVRSTFHWRPLIDGYSAYPPLTRRYLSGLVADLPAADALQELVDLVDVRWLLVHRDELPEDDRASWSGAAPPGLRLVERWGDDVLFEVTQPVANDRRASLHWTDRTLGGLPLAPLTGPCPGRVAATLVTSDGTTDVQARGRITVRIDLTNDGDVAWPAFGLYLRHLVQLEHQPWRDGRPVGIPLRAPLWVDVPPHATRTTEIILPAPALPGDYEMALGLVQDGTLLASCGVVPARLPLHVVKAPSEAAPAPDEPPPGEAPPDAAP